MKLSNKSIGITLVLLILFLVLIPTKSFAVDDTNPPTIKEMKIGGSASPQWINKANLQNNLFSIVAYDNTVAGDTGIDSVWLTLYKEIKSAVSGQVTDYCYWATESASSPPTKWVQVSVTSGKVATNWVFDWSSPYPGEITKTYAPGSNILSSYDASVSSSNKLKDGDLLYLKVRIFDGGSPSGPTDSKQYSFKLDLTAPSLTITPLSGKTLDSYSSSYFYNKADLTKGFSGTASDSVSGIKGVSLLIGYEYPSGSNNFYFFNGATNIFQNYAYGDPKAPKVTATYDKTTTKWEYKNSKLVDEIAKKPEGIIYRIQAEASDEAGNIASSSTLSVCYDNTAPTNPSSMSGKYEIYHETGLWVSNPAALENNKWYNFKLVPSFTFKDGSDSGSGIASYSLYLYKSTASATAGGPFTILLMPTAPTKTINYQDAAYYNSSSGEYALTLKNLGEASGVASDGIYTIDLYTTDKAGHTSTTPIRFTFGVDATPPDVFKTQTHTVTSSGLQLNWDKAVDQTSGIEGYKVYIKQEGETSFSDLTSSGLIKTNLCIISASTLASDKTYIWYVEAKNGAGLTTKSDKGRSATFNLTSQNLTDIGGSPSLQPPGTPTLSLGSNVVMDTSGSISESQISKIITAGTMPAAGILLLDPKDNYTSKDLSVSFLWLGPSYAASYELYIGGQLVKSTSQSGLTHSLNDGTYSWYVAVKDASGSVLATSETRTLYVNSSGPAISAKADNTILKDNLVISPTAKLSIDLSDDNIIDSSSIQILVDGTAVKSKQGASKDTSGKMVSLSADLSLPEGTHSIKISAKDSLGTESSVTYSGLKTYSGSVQVVGTPMNYPNPFKPGAGQTTTIIYTLSDNADIKIMIFDMAGRQVWQNSYPSGSNGGKADENTPTWDGKSFSNEPLGNGVYLYAITSGGKLLKRGEIAIND